MLTPYMRTTASPELVARLRKQRNFNAHRDAVRQEAGRVVLVAVRFANEKVEIRFVLEKKTPSRERTVRAGVLPPGDGALHWKRLTGRTRRCTLQSKVLQPS